EEFRAVVADGELEIAHESYPQITQMTQISKPVFQSVSSVQSADNLLHFTMPRRTSSSAHCTAFEAAPLRRLSATTHRQRALGFDGSWRTRPTKVWSVPSAWIGCGNSPLVSSISTTPGALARAAFASATETGRWNSTFTASLWETRTGTRTHVGQTP